MPFTRPTISELITQQSTELSMRFSISLAEARRSNAGVFAAVQAGGLHGVYGYLDYIAKQPFEDTADNAHLERRASIRGIARKQAQPAKGTRQLTGIDGTEVPAGSLLQRSDGIQFESTTTAIISGGSAAVDVEALLPGAIGNTAENDALNLVTPIAGVVSESASGLLSGGADIETDDSLRARTLEIIREPPHGGNDADYRKWVKETEGVTAHKVWTFKGWMGRGTVGVFFTVDGGLIPDDTQQALVESNVKAEGPVTADIYVLKPTAALTQITISNLSPNTAVVKAAIEAELGNLFNRSAEVEDGNGSGKIPVTHIREAISIAAGESDHVLVSPTADIAPTKGQLATFGGVIWQ